MYFQSQFEMVHPRVSKQFVITFREHTRNRWWETVFCVLTWLLMAQRKKKVTNKQITKFPSVKTSSEIKILQWIRNFYFSCTHFTWETKRKLCLGKLRMRISHAHNVYYLNGWIAKSHVSVWTSLFGHRLWIHLNMANFSWTKKNCK